MSDNYQEISAESRGKRLSEERKRLKLSQDELAELGGIKRNSQSRYEKTGRFDLGYLDNIQSAGIDVLYVLTGEQKKEASDGLGFNANIENAIDVAFEVQTKLDVVFNREQLKALVGFLVSTNSTIDEAVNFVLAAQSFVKHQSD